MILYFLLIDGKPCWLELNLSIIVSQFRTAKLSFYLLFLWAHYFGSYRGETVNLDKKDLYKPLLLLTLVYYLYMWRAISNLNIIEYSLKTRSCHVCALLSLSLPVRFQGSPPNSLAATTLPLFLTPKAVMAGTIFPIRVAQFLPPPCWCTT
jgi:hypothetical protein